MILFAPRPRASGKRIQSAMGSGAVPSDGPVQATSALNSQRKYDLDVERVLKRARHLQRLTDSWGTSDLISEAYRRSMKAAERFDVAASELQDMIADGPIQTVIDPEELEEFERLLGRLRRDLGRYVREYASPRTPGAPHSWRPVITRQLG